MAEEKLSWAFRKLDSQEKVTLEFSSELQLALIFGRRPEVRDVYRMGAENREIRGFITHLDPSRAKSAPTL